MLGGNRSLLDKITILLRNHPGDETLPVYIDVWEGSLSSKWLTALNRALETELMLEKNYCFFGFADCARNAAYLCDQINMSIQAINKSDLGYTIHDVFTVDNTLQQGPVGADLSGLKLHKEKFNSLHRYFEDLQGVSGRISKYYQQASPDLRWHIRQLNLLCHEFESWALSNRKKVQAPEWQRPSQLMCWLNAPRFRLDPEDYEYFGIDTISRSTGGVFVGVNKAVGKHHWEVFQDEGRDSRLAELTTTTLRTQTEAAADFDIEWARNPSDRPFMINQLNDFRTWLQVNGFDPDDKSLTIGHPQIGQVDLERSFGTTDPETIWAILSQFLDVLSVITSDASAEYPYHWSDSDFVSRQIQRISQGT